MLNAIPINLSATLKFFSIFQKYEKASMALECIFNLLRYSKRFTAKSSYLWWGQYPSVLQYSSGTQNSLKVIYYILLPNRIHCCTSGLGIRSEWWEMAEQNWVLILLKVLSQKNIERTTVEGISRRIETADQRFHSQTVRTEGGNKTLSVTSLGSYRRWTRKRFSICCTIGLL